MIKKKICERLNTLLTHPLYKRLHTPEALQLFFENYIFEIWVQHTWLKALLHRLNPEQIPWRPPSYPENILRLLHEIILFEEFDVGVDGQMKSHYAQLLDAMRSMEVSTHQIENFVFTQDLHHLNFSLKNWVRFAIETAQTANAEALAALLFYGQSQFPLVELNRNAKTTAPPMQHYIRRVKVATENYELWAEPICRVVCVQASGEFSLHALESLSTHLALRIELWNHLSRQLKEGVCVL